MSDVDAVVLVFRDRVEVVAEWDGVEIRSASASFQVPATIRLKKYVRRPTQSVRFSRRILFNRDGWKCLYCGKSLSQDTATVDHIVPKSIGGRKSWTNCATSCKSCNKRKANRTPSQAGMVLLVEPKNPTPRSVWEKIDCEEEWHDSWRDFCEI